MQAHSEHQIVCCQTQRTQHKHTQCTALIASIDCHLSCDSTEEENDEEEEEEEQKQETNETQRQKMRTHI